MTDPKLTAHENKLLDEIIECDVDDMIEDEREESQDRRGIDGNLA